MDARKVKALEQKKQRIACVTEWLTILAATFRVELSEATIKAYVEILIPFHQDRLIPAFQRTQQEWPEASKMPPPKFILDRLPPVHDRTIPGIGKPADWDPDEA